MITDYKITPTDIELWTSVLWCSSDSDGNPLDSEHSIQDVEPSDLARLNADYWQFRDRADAVLIEHGRGDASLDDLWYQLAHLFVLVREGHGVSFTDDWFPGSRTHAIALQLDRIARSYPPIGAHAEPTGRNVYCSFC